MISKYILLLFWLLNYYMAHYNPSKTLLPPDPYTSILKLDTLQVDHHQPGNPDCCPSVGKLMSSWWILLPQAVFVFLFHGALFFAVQHFHLLAKTISATFQLVYLSKAADTLQPANTWLPFNGPIRIWCSKWILRNWALKCLGGSNNMIPCQQEWNNPRFNLILFRSTKM